MMVQNENMNLHQFLVPTKLINSNHPNIRTKVEEITAGVVSDEDKAKRIFYFIRDQIRYVFRAGLEADHYLASNILKKGRGFCTQKAILFCALARCCEIPAGIYFFDIIDHSLPQNFANLLKSRTLFRHGVATLFLKNKWIQLDATLDIHLVKGNNLIPVEFHSHQNCLMHPKTKSGDKHIEYIQDYGLFSDITFEVIKSWFKQNYPHLVENHIK